MRQESEGAMAYKKPFSMVCRHRLSSPPRLPIKLVVDKFGSTEVAVGRETRFFQKTGFLNRISHQQPTSIEVTANSQVLDAFDDALLIGFERQIAFAGDPFNFQTVGTGETAG